VRKNSIGQEFGKAVRSKRMALKLSQEDLADKAGLHPTYIGLLERGKRNPSLPVAWELANSLGVKLSTLLASISR